MLLMYQHRLLGTLKTRVTTGGQGNRSKWPIVATMQRLSTMFSESVSPMAVKILLQAGWGPSLTLLVLLPRPPLPARLPRHSQLEVQFSSGGLHQMKKREVSSVQKTMVLPTYIQHRHNKLSSSRLGPDKWRANAFLSILGFWGANKLKS